MPSRSQIFRDLQKRKNENLKTQNGNKRVCKGDKPFTGMKKKEEKGER